MKNKICYLEKEVLDCLKTGKLTSEIKKHISECPLCKDMVLVYEWMNQFKDKSWAAEMPGKTLPDPESIWEGAYTKPKPNRKLIRKALRPLTYTRVFSYAVLAVGIIYLFLANIKPIGNILASTAGGGFIVSSLSRVIVQYLPLFLIPVVIVLISILFCALVAAFERQKGM
ncbi:MAG: hypothetical protein ACE5GI_00360 [Candidatus Aminicenantales bacterium]